MHAISAAVQQQIGDVIQPATALTSGEEPSTANRVIDAEPSKSKTRSPRKRSSSSKSTGDGSPTQAIDFRHDPDTFGNPQQGWSVTEKSIWLLAVLKGLNAGNEIPGPQIAATFNEKFKQAGKVHPPHVTRDLGNAKVQNPAPVGEQKGVWYLTQEGDRQAQELINSVLNPPTV